MRHLLGALYLQLMEIPQKAIFQSLGNMSDISQHLIQLNAIKRRRIDPNDTSGIIVIVGDVKEGDVSELEPPAGNVGVPPSDKTKSVQ